MNISSEDQLGANLNEFRKTTQLFIRQGRQLLKEIEKTQGEQQIKKPLLLKITLDKCLEMVEDRLQDLLPELNSVLSKSPDELDVAAAHRDFAHKVNKNCAVDDFRNSNPRGYPIARKPVTPEPTSKAPPGDKPRVVEDFRAAPRRASAPEPVAEKPPATSVAAASEVTPGPKHSGLQLMKMEAGSKRRSPRYKCRIPLVYHTSTDTSNNQRAYSRDVGAMGMFIMANRPEKKGESLEIEVELPGNIRARLTAVVQWSKWIPPNLRSVDQPGFGVKVINATENWYQYFKDT